LAKGRSSKLSGEKEAPRTNVVLAPPTIFRVDGFGHGTQPVTIKSKKGSEMGKEKQEKEREERIRDTNATGFIAHVGTMTECTLNLALNRTRG